MLVSKLCFLATFLKKIKQFKLGINRKIDWNKHQSKALKPVLRLSNRSKDNYKLFSIDFSKKNLLDASPNAMQQINFIESLGKTGHKTIVFII